MPQMMPLNWFLLFSFFSFTLILFNLMNFYMTFNKNINYSSKMTFKSLIWKW